MWHSQACHSSQAIYIGKIISYPEQTLRGTSFVFLSNDGCAYSVIVSQSKEFHIFETITLNSVSMKNPSEKSPKTLQYIYRNQGTLFARAAYPENRKYVLASFFEGVRAYITKSAETLSAESRGLYLGMILGEKSALSPELKEVFVLSGLIHIVVLSGQNLSFMGMFFWRIARRFGFTFGIIVGVVSTLLYVCLGGGEPPSLRAGCMMFMIFCGYALKASPSGPRVFWFSVCGLLIFSPFLIFNLSFLLSCLAMIGIFYASPIVENWMLNKKWNVTFVTYLAPVVAVQIYLLPIIIHISDAFTPYALIANICVLFTIPFINILSLIHVVTSVISPAIGEFMSAMLLDGTLSYVVKVTTFVSKLPYASLPVHLSEWMVWVWYAFSFFLFITVWRKKTVTPLSLYTLREEIKQDKKGLIPWFHDSTEYLQNITLDCDMKYSRREFHQADTPEETIFWS